MDAAGMAKLVTLLVLIGLFVAAVLITPRIWHANVTRAAEPVKGQDKAASSAERGSRSESATGASGRPDGRTG